ncbi:hypothetical protein ANCCEY_05191 [Ancylostoma ceylanicum]|uniref:Uncharacterized protein n=1 Tax=Ancylostoma ceylanicum TaxID=53326 RepID=A0A0D6LV11_9BILA|nr:hypothetical protein ANCCEY_05191 [Ancylostoma ceylanicum]
MANFCRELPGFDLKFACNFKGCLDNRPLSMMGAIEHQAFHFCETFKTQAHFNFKCDFCNVYHVNKSHHRLCLNDATGNGHITYLRSVFTVPMSDQEYHDCVDFSRFANQHMLAVTGEGIRLVPEDRCSSMTRYSLDSTPGAPSNSGSSFNNKRNSVSYRDIDNDTGGGDNDRFNRSGGNFSDRNQNGSYEYRGRGGRGGYRGRGDRGGFGRGRGRGGGHRDGGFNKSQARSYSRSRSGSPAPRNTNTVSRPPASYSRSRSGSRSPPRNDENNNRGRADRDDTRPNPTSNNVTGRGNTGSNESNVFTNGEANRNKQWSNDHVDKFNDSQCDGGRGVKRAAE